MAQIAFNGELQMGTAALPTTLVDYSSLIKSIKFTRNGETIDVTTFGNNAKKWIKGLTDADFQIEAFYSGAFFSAMQNALSYLAGGLSFQYGPEGTTATNVKVSQVGTLNSSTGVGLLIEAVDDTTDVAQVKMLSIKGKISGAITFGTY